MSPSKRKSRIRELDSQADGADFLSSATGGSARTEIQEVDLARFVDDDEPPQSEILFI